MNLLYYTPPGQDIQVKIWLCSASYSDARTVPKPHFLACCGKHGLARQCRGAGLSLHIKPIHCRECDGI